MHFCTFGRRSKHRGRKVVPEGGAKHPAEGVVTNLGDASVSLCDIIRGAEVQTCDDRERWDFSLGFLGEFADRLDTRC